MLREFKFFRRKSPTADQNNENIPLDQNVSSASQQDADPSRLPFSAIQEPERNPRSGLDQETHLRRKSEKTPSKSHVKGSDQFFQSRTPDKLPASKGSFGWVPIIEQAGWTSPERREYSLHQGQFQMPPPPPLIANHALNFGNGYSAATPRSITTGGRASSVHSGTSSTQSTPTKSVSKPMINGVSNSRAPQCGGTAKAMNFLASSKGIPLPSAPPPVYASVEVPHFELKEDPSFWMDHNVQVVIRVRPINIIERSLQGYNRCIKQESAQSITWIGQSETRFMFDYVAGETVNQEMLFRVAGLPMVENCMSGYNSCVFAYGQTGSGKTHTMLGEINDLEIRPSTNRGMTPRIFEFLFARIKAEEESRRDEKLKYTCKCSFLEIYNEQITDLLNPTSTNLLIREDPRKGVHVENLSEFEVENVYDTLQLLIQGAANRKVSPTMMNRESSRSHSVFTCTIESRWQKDSTSTLRFARLNLVDLAGSERQKTSGAEGNWLKEASNINKSLSTLGHVIMVLADLANGRQRHVPYRDSRLTFLLQDSLGGNSKTMIIANVSPSICSANETLSTLKFAQRAKVIQNNAVVNENASGDVFALHHQIHLLKEELSMLKQQNISRSLSFRTATLENADYDAYSPQKLPGILSDFNQIPDNEKLQDVRVLNKQLKSFEAMLAGAFRREKMAAIAMRQLEVEIEQLNRLVRQREEDAQCSKMMIKFREDKIYRMEALLNGLIPSESYLREENNALSEEIKLLRTKIDRNPEVTRFASENIRLLEELRKFQDFYDEGERGILLTELSELRNQLAQFLDGNLKSDINAQDLSLASPEKVPCSCSTKHAEEVLNLEQELDRLKTIIALEKSSRVEAEERAIFSETELSITNEKLLQISKRYDVTIDNLKDKKSVIDALESQQMLSINELEELRENNNRLADTVKIQEQQISTMKNQLALRIGVGNRKSIIAHEILREDYSKSECSSPFQDKLKRVQASLEKAWNLNVRYQSDLASHSSSEREMDEVRRQVEAETAEVIVCLQEELTTVNQIVDECNKNELLAKQRLVDLEKEKKEQDDKLYLLTLENIRLAKLTEEKEQNMSSIMEHWEQLAIEISDLLENGKTQLDDATHEAASISDICSHKSWICEQFGKIIMGISKRDSLIEELQKNLEVACYVRHDIESKLMTLRGAILAITEAQQQENSDKESRILHLTSLLTEKTSIISEFSVKLNSFEEKIVGLQFIEETMLERSNSICHELDVLRDKLNAANKDNDEANERLEELSLLLNKVQVTNKTLRDELDMEVNEKVKADEKLGMELFNLNNLLDRKTHLLEDLQKEMYCIKYENDKLESNVSTLTEKLILVEVNKSIAAEQVENQLMENEELKLRLMEMSMVLDQKKHLYEDLQKEICCFKHENDKLESLVSTLTEKLILVEENKAIAAAELENQLMENEELKLRLMGMSMIIEELRRKYEAACKESDYMKTIAMERLKKELIDASILIGQVDVLVEELQKDVSRIAHEKDEFESEAYTLKEKLILFEENKVIVAEQLENQLTENEELKLRLMAMSMVLDELQGKYEVVCKESNNTKTIALERLKKELLDASILIGQRDVLVEELQKDMSRIAHEKDEFESEAYTLKEKLILAKSIAEKNEAVETEAPQRKLLMENEQLKLQVKNMTRMLHEVQTLNRNLQEELEDKMSSEILQKKLHDLINGRSNVLEEFQNEITVITHSKEQLESQVSILKEKLKMAESLAVVNKVVAIEARQIAEERRSYAEVKEEEVKLLERSIEELECTVNALQEQVKIVKAEAERQRIQRNELEMEEEAKRQLKENLSELETAQHSIQLLQKEATERELELVQCKSIISELNLHAEAQASEYNRKFKELEAMAFQLKTELVTSNTANPTSTKSEKGAAKSRGSGSPFKCIVGLAQQINTEKDEELTVARCKIEELEALAANRQNQIFMLNIRLAAAESMTHDVLRDLLGIKLDMTKYAKMNGGSHSDDSMKEKDKELGELKGKVDEFVEERKSLLEEINRTHQELIAAQIRLGKLEEHEEFLSTENELLKADNAKYKNIVTELEEELDKISIQLNMQ